MPAAEQQSPAQAASSIVALVKYHAITDRRPHSNHTHRHKRRTKTYNSKSLSCVRTSDSHVVSVRPNSLKNHRSPPAAMVASGGGVKCVVTVSCPAFLLLALLLSAHVPRCHTFHLMPNHHSPIRPLPWKETCLSERITAPQRLPLPATTRLVSAVIAASTASDVHAAPFSSEQVMDYLRHGHTVTRHVFPSKDIATIWKPRIMAAFEQERCEALRHEVHVFFGEEAYEACTTTEACLTQLSKKDAEAIRPFLQVFNLWRRHPEIKELVFSKTLAHIAAQLLGAPRVRLFQDSLFVKRPGDDPTLLHTDLGTAPLDTNDFITAWIPLTHVPAVEEGGSPLQFCQSSHIDMAARYWYDPHDSGDGDETAALPPPLLRYPVTDYAPLGLGDITWHHGWCLHGSPGNKREEERVALTVCFMSADAKVMASDVLFFPDEEDSLSYEEWVGEVGLGNVVDHKLTPVVWP